jgi:hypothetical protein
MCEVGQGSSDFPKMLEPLQNYGRQKVDVKQVTYLGPTNIMCHRKKLSWYRDVAPGNPALLNLDAVDLSGVKALIV